MVNAPSIVQFSFIRLQWMELIGLLIYDRAFFGSKKVGGHFAIRSVDLASHSQKTTETLSKVNRLVYNQLTIIVFVELI